MLTGVQGTMPGDRANSGCCDLRDGKHRIAAIVRRAAAEPGRPAESRSRQGHRIFVAAKLAPRHRVGRQTSACCGLRHGKHRVTAIMRRATAEPVIAWIVDCFEARLKNKVPATKNGCARVFPCGCSFRPVGWGPARPTCCGLTRRCVPRIWSRRGPTGMPTRPKSSSRSATTKPPEDSAWWPSCTRMKMFRYPWRMNCACWGTT